ncbi:MAG: glycosyltransferase family 2 protein [Kiritimatiellae bacterium]|nr:glycosyltransferase family 2 protein [Kiritimatiellia bacterium]
MPEPVPPPASRPKVSILLAVFNAETTLRQCLDSALAQTVRDIEIVCVDDGSADGSPAILAEYAARDPRVKVVRQANAGTMGARKTGIERARGDWCAFLDPDDWLEPDACELLLARAGAAGADVAGCGCILHPDADCPEMLVRRKDDWMNRPPWSGSAEEFLVRSYVERRLPYNLSAKIVRTDLCKAAYAATSGARVTKSEDPCGMFRILLGARRVAYTDEKRYHYRIGSGSSSRTSFSLAEIVSCFGVLEEAESVRRAAEAAGPGPAAVGETFADTVAGRCCGWIMDSLADRKDRAAAWAALAAHPCRGRTIAAFTERTAEKPRETVALLLDTCVRLERVSASRDAAVARLRKTRRELARLREAQRHPVRHLFAAALRRLRRPSPGGNHPQKSPSP